MKYLTLILCLTLTGCAHYHRTLTIDAKGKDFRTRIGKIKAAKADLVSELCLGKHPKTECVPDILVEE